MKIGLSVKLDVSKIDKSRLFKGEKGTYLDLTTFINLDEADQYGNHGFISQSVTKEEREQKVQTPILGNVKAFYTEGGQSAPAAPHSDDGFSDDIPFTQIRSTNCF